MSRLSFVELFQNSPARNFKKTLLVTTVLAAAIGTACSAPKSPVDPIAPVVRAGDRHINMGDMVGKPASFNGHWVSSTCRMQTRKGGRHCALDLNIAQSTTFAIDGSFQFDTHVSQITLPTLNITANFLCNPKIQCDIKTPKNFAGQIGMRAFTVVFPNNERLTAKLLPTGEMGFVAVTTAGKLIEGIAALVTPPVATPISAPTPDSGPTTPAPSSSTTIPTTGGNAPQQPSTSVPEAPAPTGTVPQPSTTVPPETPAPSGPATPPPAARAPVPAPGLGSN